MNRILIVEDDPQLQLLYRSVLERAGFSVITALNGEDALKKLEAIRIELIITDIMMPKMDGFEVLAFIKKKKLECQPCGYYDLCGQFSCEYKTGI